MISILIFCCVKSILKLFFIFIFSLHALFSIKLIISCLLFSIYIYMKKINFLDLRKNINCCRDEIKEKINNIIDNTSFIGGSQIKEFEDNFAKYSGFDYFIGCANGTDALEIAVQSLDLNAEDEIIVQGNTYIATCLSVTNNNLNLVLCDIDKNTNMICLNDLKNKITKKTKAIIVVHLYGLVP